MAFHNGKQYLGKIIIRIKWHYVYQAPNTIPNMAINTNKW